MQVIIAGLGDTGWKLAETLTRRGGDVTLVDTDADRCDHAAGELDALVLHGDGADPEILEKARIDAAAALVATTDSDAINTVIAMLAKQAGVGRVVVKLKGLALRSACEEIGVTRVVAPSASAAAEIDATVRGFHRLDFSLAARGELSLVDLDGRVVEGSVLSELDLPRGAIVVAVLRDDEAVFPDPAMEVRDTDVLLTLVSGDDVREVLRERFREKDGEGSES